MPNDRTLVLQLAFEMLTRAMSSPPDEFVVDIYTPDGVRVQLRARPGEFSQPNAAPGGDELPDLPGYEGCQSLAAAVLKVITAAPVEAKVLARQCNRPLNSHFYRALRYLAALNPPKIAKVAGGYRLLTLLMSGGLSVLEACLLFDFFP